MTIYSLNDRAYEGEENADVVIIGAGALGITLAVTIARQGRRVILLEAGPRHPPVNFQKANRGPTSGRTFTRMETGRMRAYGGTTRLWGGQLVPFDVGDIESVDENGKRLWPISYDEVSPWIDVAFDLLGVDAAARDRSAVYHQATGENGQLGHGLQTMLTIWLRQPDFTRLFAKELEDSPLITVVTDAEVQRFEFADNGNLETLHIGNDAGRSLTIRPRTVVLAAGTMESVRQLLRAQAISPNCPFRDNRNVGHWYLDHLNGTAGHVEISDPKAFGRLFHMIFAGGRKYQVKIVFADRRPLHSANISSMVLPPMTIREVVADAQQLLRRVIGGQKSPITAVRDAVGIMSTIVPFAWRYLIDRRAGLVNSNMRIGYEIEQMPVFDSYLYLDPTHPPETAPIGVHWHVGGREMETTSRFCEALAAAFSDLKLGDVVISPPASADDPAFLDDFYNSGHYMGGARMAESPEDGVVDRDCKVFGCSNLYLAGAMVFPTGSFANSTLTAIALGQRLAAHLTVAHKDAGE